MNLTHNAAEPFEYDPERTYFNSRAVGYGKPAGFWVSDDDEYGWKQWCTDNEFRTYAHEYSAHVELADDANILFIRSREQLVRFHQKYSYNPYPQLRGTAMIDWDQVAEKYDGIIITPYRWDTRYDMDMLWYNGWDCASGCIWNLNAIKTVTPIQMEEAA
jgi:hypothetical protein